MFKLSNDLLEKGQDLVKDLQDGKLQEQVESVKKMMSSLGVTPEQAMDKLKIPESQQSKILELLNKISK